MDHLCSSIEAQLQLARGECRRLFHGRGGCWPGYENLVVDWLPPCVVIRLYGDFPQHVLEVLQRSLATAPEVQSIVLQTRGGQEIAHRWLLGEPCEKQVVQENGLKFQVFPALFQNTGLFLDMRNGRRWVREHSQGLRVLNLFAYTCGFSVAALAGSAAKVVNVDMSKRALSIGRENHRLNGQDLSRVQFMGLNLFKSWSRIRKSGPYDLIIIDPPSYQPGSFVAVKDYQKVLKRLPQLMASGACVLACHNAPEEDDSFLKSSMAVHCPTLKWVESIALQDDFPEQNPDAGVKALVFS